MYKRNFPEALSPIFEEFLNGYMCCKYTAFGTFDAKLGVQKLRNRLTLMDCADWEVVCQLQCSWL